MTDFKVDVAAEVANASKTVKGVGQKLPSDMGSGNARDVSHLRPMAEGALRAAGLHGGVDKDGKVIDLRAENDGAVDVDPNTQPGDDDYLRKQRLEWKTQGLVERNTNADGTVTLRLVHGDGDVTTAKAATDAEALDALIAKVGGTK